MFGGRLALRNTMALIGLLALIVGVAQWRGGSIVTAQGGAVISGTVYQDYNGNGTQDTATTIANLGGGTVRLSQDRGLSGVVVTAFNGAGAVVATATANASGAYTLNPTGAGPFRIEFSNLPTGFQPGPVGGDNGTTVRFVQGTSANVDLGIILPGEYCQDNPDLVTSCFQVGNQALSVENAVFSFPYTAGSNSQNVADYDQTAPNLEILAPETGSVWGLEKSRTRRTVYAAAFYKKHAGFGPGANGTFNEVTPSDDPGAIYVIDRGSGAVTQTFTVPDAQTNAHDVTNYLTDNFAAGWDAVGKTSLGGIALSPDEATLYVMNLENRTLYALNATTGVVTALQTVPGVTEVTGSAASGAAPPLAAPSVLTACPAGDIRPFAVTYYEPSLYVGITCTAESTQQRNDLWAYIYQVNPATLAFSAAPVFDFSLAYDRGLANLAGAIPADWLPWVPSFAQLPGIAQFVFYPQPWLTDVTFDNGNLVLGFRDRTGDTTGFDAPVDPADPTGQFSGVGIGDVLRACGTPAAGWTLENNGSCGGVNTTPGTTPNPRNLPQGPGGEEYYFDDGYGISGQAANHDEVSLGGAVQVPGRPDVLVSAFDPFPFNPPFEVFDGGVRWYGNDTGAFEKGHRIFNTTGAGITFGKANGLGDLIVLCDEAPIEIGNRVWRDDDKDGIQDSGEPVIANVTLELYQGTTLIATAVTDAAGNYIFSAYRTPADSTTAFRYGLNLKPNTQYSVRVPNTSGANKQAALNTLVPTTPNVAGTGNDVRDSDGVVAGTFVQTVLTTGGVGANNHTYDFGFHVEPTAIVLESFTSRLVSGGAVVEWRTAMELDTWGFHLYRSTTGELADAVRVTKQLILAKGNSSTGASYTYFDATATDGPYTYWLEEHTRDGARKIYGPETTKAVDGGTHQAWLPVVVR